MTKHPEEFADTDPRVLEAWMEMLRAKTPGERIAMAFELSEFAVKVAESGVRARHPGASEREIFLRSAALRLPRDLMIRVYGWDPETPIEEFLTNIPWDPRLPHQTEKPLPTRECE